MTSQSAKIIRLLVITSLVVTNLHLFTLKVSYNPVSITGGRRSELRGQHYSIHFPRDRRFCELFASVSPYVRWSMVSLVLFELNGQGPNQVCLGGSSVESLQRKCFCVFTVHLRRSQTAQTAVCVETAGLIWTLPVYRFEKPRFMVWFILQTAASAFPLTRVFPFYFFFQLVKFPFQFQVQFCRTESASMRLSI